MNVFGQETSTLIDARDNQEYKIVDIKIALEAGIFIHRVWMAQNLNFNSPGSACYKNYDAYCVKFGRLYTWDGANNACPDGFHMSTRKEWREILDTYGGRQVAGKALKEGGESNLNIIMAGFSDAVGNFSDVGKTAHLWDAENKDTKSAGLISLYEKYDEVAHDQIKSGNKNSCRCIKDY